MWIYGGRSRPNKDMKKICITCKKEFILPDWKQYKNRMLCSKKCARRDEAWKKNASLKKISYKNPMWKGDSAGYHAIHEWIRRRKKKPDTCENCKNASPMDLANISQEYHRDINDFEWLCRKCHMDKDGRKIQLAESAKSRAVPRKEINCSMCKKTIITIRKNQSCCSLSCCGKKANLKRWGTLL